MTNPSYLAGLGHPAILYKINRDKKDPKHLPGLGHPSLLYKFYPDKKDPRHLPGLSHPTVFIKLKLIRKILVIYLDFAFAPILINLHCKTT
jgi:hypothetical protein